MIRILLAALLMAASVSSTAGCGFRDIDKRMFALALGVDSEGSTGNYRVTLRFAVPESEPQKKPKKYLIDSGVGKTFSEAVEKLKAKIGPEIDLSQTKLIIFGSSISNRDLKPALDWLTRKRDVSKNVYLGVAQEDARSILERDVSYERLPLNSLILTMRKSGAETNYVTQVMLYEFYRNYRARGVSPVMPYIVNLPESDAYKIDKLVVFNKHELAREALLAPEETEIHNLLAYSQARMIVHASVDNMEVNIRMHHLKVRYGFDRRNHSVTVAELNVSVEGSIEEGINSMTAKQLSKYQTKVEEELRHRVFGYLEKMRDLNLDPVGLGSRYLAGTLDKSGEVWREWEDAYPKLKFRILTHVKLKIPA
jgi:spore germination protein KC